MKDPQLMPSFVFGANFWYLVFEWEPGRAHGPASIRPLTPTESAVLTRSLDDSLTEAWALITAPRVKVGP